MKKEKAFTVKEMKLPTGSVLRYSISAAGAGAACVVVPADQSGVKPEECRWMTEKLTQEDANIHLAAAGLAMADIGQSVVQIAHLAAKMAQDGLDLSQELSNADQSSADTNKE